MRVSALCLEIAEQTWINPSRNHFVSVLQPDSSKSVWRNGWVAGKRGVATLPRSRSQRPRVGGLTMQQVTVRVPASTSNLGPGYDCLGVALRLYNSVTVVRGNKPRSSHPRIVSDAAVRFFKQTRRRAFSFSCSVVERVPRCRGLGSSATVRLGILLALNRLSGDPLDRLSLFGLCAELEGHPDNAAPAAFGGFTITRSDGFPAVMFRRLPKPRPLVLRFKDSMFHRTYISFFWCRSSKSKPLVREEFCLQRFRVLLR